MRSLEQHLRRKQQVLFGLGVALLAVIGWAVVSSLTGPASGSAIELVDAADQSLVSIPVRRNVFRLASPPPGAIGFAALDRDGHVVYAERIFGR